MLVLLICLGERSFSLTAPLMTVAHATLHYVFDLSLLSQAAILYLYNDEISAITDNCTCNREAKWQRQTVRRSHNEIMMRRARREKEGDGERGRESKQ